MWIRRLCISVGCNIDLKTESGMKEWNGMKVGKNSAIGAGQLVLAYGEETLDIMDHLFNYQPNYSNLTFVKTPSLLIPLGKLCFLTQVKSNMKSNLKYRHHLTSEADSRDNQIWNQGMGNRISEFFKLNFQLIPYTSVGEAVMDPTHA